MTRPSARGVFLGFLVGMLTLQAAWILAVPAYRGIDEFDHAYQAAAVARGQWHATEPAKHGRGGVVEIPRDIVRAASPVCRGYSYVGHDNCYPIANRTDDLVLVATAAGNYNPAYYLAAGAVARPFSGQAFDYAMRAFTAIVCALLIGWAAALTVSWSPSSAWPRLALLIGITPVFSFSMSIAAPNGISYACAALLWSALISLTRSERLIPGVIATGTGIAGLALTHSSGLLWTPIIVVAAAILARTARWQEVWRGARRAIVPIAAGVAMVCAFSIWWIRYMSTNALGPATPLGGGSDLPVGDLPLYHVVWALETIAVFPTRSEPAPIPVYLLWIGVLGVLLAVAGRLLIRREALALGFLAAFLVVVPTVLSIAAYPSEGWAWQGRYSLPLWLGATTIAGVALTRSRRVPPQAVVLCLVGAMATALALSVVHVAWEETVHGRVAPALSSKPGMVLLAVLCVAGYAVIAATGLRERHLPMARLVKATA